MYTTQPIDLHTSIQINNWLTSVNVDNKTHNRLLITTACLQQLDEEFLKESKWKQDNNNQSTN